MSDFLSNPPWWAILLIGWLLPSFGWVRSQLPRLAQIPSMVSSAHGATRTFIQSKARAFFRGRERKRLLKIKAVRFHSLLINQQIAKSHINFALFIVFGFAYLAGVIVLAGLANEEMALRKLWIILTGVFAITFELLWLISSGRVSALLKHRRKIRRRRMRLV